MLEEREYQCPVAALSNILGRKWVASIIWYIKTDKKRFGEIQRHLENCSNKMLKQQLELLIEIGIVINEKYSSNNSIESYYYLNKEGLELLPIIEKMIKWGKENINCKEYFLNKKV